MAAGPTMVSRYELSNENLFMPLFSSLISLPNCSQLDLQLAGEEGDIASFIPNGEWSLLGEIHSSSVFYIYCLYSKYGTSRHLG